MNGSPQQPSQYLLDPAKRSAIAAHDPKLVVWSTPPYFDGDVQPTPIPTFNRSREVELLLKFLGQYSDQAFEDDSVTVDDAALTVYGTVDPDLKYRVTDTHLTPGSVLNKPVNTNGTVFVCSDNVHIVKQDRGRVVEERFREDAEAYGKRMRRTSGVASRELLKAQRRATRVGGQAVLPQIRELTQQVTEHSIEEQRRALGMGE